MLEELAGSTPARSFRRTLAEAQPPALISELKRRSPSKGELRVDLDPAVLARQYQAGGATCLSVLTDSDWFGGSSNDLAAARGAVGLPVLRKDFTVDVRDVIDTRLMGADCVLLIVAALDDAELADFARLANEIGLDALIEVHDEAELERAMAIEPNLIGVNQRDLTNFEVDSARAERMAGRIPDAVLRVAESGITERADVLRLVSAGYQALLVGEALVRSSDPSAALQELCGTGPA